MPITLAKLLERHRPVLATVRPALPTPAQFTRMRADAVASLGAATAAVADSLLVTSHETPCRDRRGGVSARSTATSSNATSAPASANMRPVASHARKRRPSPGRPRLQLHRRHVPWKSLAVCAAARGKFLSVDLPTVAWESRRRYRSPPAPCTWRRLRAQWAISAAASSTAPGRATRRP